MSRQETSFKAAPTIEHTCVLAHCNGLINRSFGRLEKERVHETPFQHPLTLPLRVTGHCSYGMTTTHVQAVPRLLSFAWGLGDGTRLGAPPRDLPMKMLEEIPKGRMGGAKTSRTKTFQKFRSLHR